MEKLEILELNVQPEHVNIILSIPLKISILKVIGILKRKIAIKIFKSLKTYWGNHFWSRDYCSSTVGVDERKIRKYVKYRE